MNFTNNNIVISGGNFTLHAPPKEQSAIEYISGAIQDRYVSRATHDNDDILDPPKCHPGTRMSILNRLSEWVEDTGNPIYNMTWLRGPAGAGKSAIARSLAGILHAKGLLAGSFFFCHSDPRRSFEKPLVATLVQQLAESRPETQPYIEHCLIHNPTIFCQSLPTQFQKLIFNPIVESTLKSTFRPALIIIDGLDECKDSRARSLILETLFNALPQLRGSLKFLIASRPEHDIETPFRTAIKAMGESIHVIDLLSDIRAHDDINLYFRDHFERIKQEHPLRTTFEPDWPLENAIQKLVDKSSGQFIYASTVIKYIQNVHDRPQECLDNIINLRQLSPSPYGELDVLYGNILSSSKADQNLLRAILSAALICGSMQYCWFLGRAPQDPTKYDRFVESVLHLKPGTVELTLVDLKSLMGLGSSFYIPEKRVNGEFIGGISYPDIKCIEFWHKSFSDFLFDKARSKEFHVPFNLAHTVVAEGSLQLLSDNCKWMKKYWPDEEQRFWLTPAYHYTLSQSCLHALYDHHLHNAMMSYNLLNLLQIQSYECRRSELIDGEHRVGYFGCLLFSLLCFKAVKSFEGIRIYRRLRRQFYEQLRCELKSWVSPDSKLMGALKGAIKPIGIDWLRLNTLLDDRNRSLLFREIVLSKDLSGDVEWPHFLEWLLDCCSLSDGIGNGDLFLLVCRAFIHVTS